LEQFGTVFLMVCGSTCAVHPDGIASPNTERGSGTKAKGLATTLEKPDADGRTVRLAEERLTRAAERRVGLDPRICDRVMPAVLPVLCGRLPPEHVSPARPVSTG
jgi:hypothetical protein